MGQEGANRLPGKGVTIRHAVVDDLPAIIRLDERATGAAKPDYWQKLFAHFSQPAQPGRAFLVACNESRVVGFMIGEVRAFEFNSEPCGWIFALTVDSQLRMQSIGTRLFEEICAIFRAVGVDKIRTMIARDDHLVLAFFRSLGMMAGPFIQLEWDLD